MATPPDELDALLKSLSSGGAKPPAPPVKTSTKPVSGQRGINGTGSTDDYLKVFKQNNPDFANLASGFIDFAKRAGVNDVYIKNGARTAEYQNYLHTHGYPTKGNDGYVKISPHQEYRAIDWSTKSSANRSKMHDLLAVYARNHGLHVPTDEPWHMAGAPWRKATKSLVSSSTTVQPDELDDLLSTLQAPATSPQQSSTPAAPTASPVGLQSQPVATAPGTDLKPPAIPKEVLNAPETDSLTASVPIYQPPYDEKSLTGNVGRIMDSGPEAQQAYRQFLQKNIPHVKGKAVSPDELMKNETLATTFVNLHEYLANNPKASAKEQTKEIAQMGVDFLKDENTKGMQLPKILHEAILSAHWTPDEFKSLPGSLRQQIAQRHAQAQAARKPRPSARDLARAAVGQSVSAESGGPDETPTPYETPPQQAARIYHENASRDFMRAVNEERQRTIMPGDPSFFQRLVNRGISKEDAQAVVNLSSGPPTPSILQSPEDRERTQRERTEWERHQIAVNAMADSNVLTDRLREKSTQRPTLQRVLRLLTPTTAVDALSEEPKVRMFTSGAVEATGELSDTSADLLHFVDTLGDNIEGNKYVAKLTDRLRDFGAYLEGAAKIEPKMPGEAFSKSAGTMAGQAEKFAIMKGVTKLPFWAIMGGEAALRTQTQPLSVQAKETAWGIVQGVGIEYGPGVVTKVLGKMPGTVGSLARQFPELIGTGTTSGGFGGLAYEETKRKGGSTAEALGAGAGAAVATAGLSLAGGGAKELAGEASRAEATPEWLRDRLAKAGGLDRAVVVDTGGRAISLYGDPQSKGVGGEEISPERAEKYAKRGPEEMPVLRVSPGEFEQVKNLIKSKPTKTGGNITKTITGETEAADADSIRSDKGQSAQAAPESQRVGVEEPGGSDIRSERQGRQSVEPREVAPQRQEAVQSEAALEKASAKEVAKAPAEVTSSEQATPATGIARVPVADLNLDPDRFQYKLKRNQRGGTGVLKGVSQWNPNLEGVISVWRDPVDGKTYVVNGHNRVEKAQDLGVKDITVRHIDAPTADKARAIGALINIGEGQGTALDTAKFLKDSGITPEEMKAQGIPLTRKTTNDGVALSKLDDFVFNSVVRGDLPEELGVAIGNKIQSLDLQRQAFKAIAQAQEKGRALTKPVVDEMLDAMTAAPRIEETDQTLFGDVTSERSLVTERAQVASALKRQLSSDKSLFGTAMRKSERLAEGGTKVDLAKARELQESASEALDVFDTLKNRAGAISAILDAGAQKVLAGKRPDVVAKESYEPIRRAVAAVLGRGSEADVQRSVESPERVEGESGQRSLVEPASEPAKKSAAAGDEGVAKQPDFSQTPPPEQSLGAQGIKQDLLDLDREQAQAKVLEGLPKVGPTDELDKMLAELPKVDTEAQKQPKTQLVSKSAVETPAKEDVTHGRQKAEEVQSKALPPAESTSSEETVGDKESQAASRSSVRPVSKESEGTGRSTERTFGPGAAAKGDVPQEDPLSQFTAAARNAIKEGNPKTPDDTFNLAEAAAEKWAKAKSLATKGFAGLRSGVASVAHAYMNPVPKIDDELTARGLWDGNIQRARQNIRTQSKMLIKAVPNRLDRRAIGAYAGAIAAADKAQVSPEELLTDWASKSKGYTRRIYARAAKLSDAHKTIARNSLSMMEQMGEYALDPKKMMSQVEGVAGPRSKSEAPPPLLKHLLEDYFPRIVKDPNKPENALHIQGQLNEFALGKMPTNFKFARQRVFGSEFEGEQNGIIYGDKDFVGRQAAYLNAFYNTFFTRMYLKDLLRAKEADGRPTVTVSGGGTPIVENEPAYKAEVPDIFIVRAGKKPKVSVGTPEPGVEHEEPAQTSDYQFVSHPTMKGWRWLGDIGGVPILYEGNLLVHPDKVKDFRAMLGRSWFQQHAATRWGLQALGTAKSLVVAGGLFHPVQTGIRGAVRGVVPVKDYNPFAMKPPDMKDPDTWLLARTGTLFADNHALARFAEGVGTSGILNKIPGIGTHVLHPLSEWVFLEYIPAMKAMLGKNWLKANRKRYPNLSEDEVGALTSRQVNATFGLQNVRYIARHPSTQDFLRTITFAPDWNESKLKSYGQALRPYGRGQLFALLKMAFGMWIFGRIMNKLLDDDYHFDTPFTVVYNGREYGLKSDVTDFQMMVTNPRTWAAHRANFLTSGALELLTRTDDRGQRVDFTQAIGDIIKSVQPIALGRRRPGEQWWEGPLNSTGVTNYKYYTPAERVLTDYLNEKPRVRSSPDERHQLIRELKDKAKKGDIEPEISDALEKGKLTLADTRQIRDDAQASDFSLMMKHVPLEIALNAFEKADEKQKDEARLELALKLQNAKPDVFTDEMRARLEKDGFTVPAKIGAKRKTSEARRETQKVRKEKKAVNRWLPPESRPQIQKRYQVTPR